MSVHKRHFSVNCWSFGVFRIIHLTIKLESSKCSYFDFKNGELLSKGRF